MNKVKIGKYGEDLACAYLKTKGYKIIERNFRIRGGEIDIIALDGKTLVYVEVKTRTTFEFGRPEESITWQKLKFLERVAKFYRASRPNLPAQERIDMVSVNLKDNQTYRVNLIKNATF